MTSAILTELVKYDKLFQHHTSSLVFDKGHDESYPEDLMTL